MCCMAFCVIDCQIPLPFHADCINERERDFSLSLSLRLKLITYQTDLRCRKIYVVQKWKIKIGYGNGKWKMENLKICLQVKWERECVRTRLAVDQNETISNKTNWIKNQPMHFAYAKWIHNELTTHIFIHNECEQCVQRTGLRAEVD